MFSLNKTFTNSFFPLGFYEIKNFLNVEEKVVMLKQNLEKLNNMSNICGVYE